MHRDSVGGYLKIKSWLRPYPSPLREGLMVLTGSWWSRGTGMRRDLPQPDKYHIHGNCSFFNIFFSSSALGSFHPEASG